MKLNLTNLRLMMQLRSKFNITCITTRSVATEGRPSNGVFFNLEMLPLDGFLQRLVGVEIIILQRKNFVHEYRMLKQRKKKSCETPIEKVGLCQL